MQKTLLTPERAEWIITARRQRRSIAECARLGGVSASTLRAWICAKPRRRNTTKPPLENAFRDAWLRVERENLFVVADVLKRALDRDVVVVDVELREMVNA